MSLCWRIHVMAASTTGNEASFSIASGNRKCISIQVFAPVGDDFAVAQGGLTWNRLGFAGSQAIGGLHRGILQPVSHRHAPEAISGSHSNALGRGAPTLAVPARIRPVAIKNLEIFAPLGQLFGYACDCAASRPSKSSMPSVPITLRASSSTSYIRPSVPRMLNMIMTSWSPPPSLCGSSSGALMV